MCRVTQDGRDDMSHLESLMGKAHDAEARKGWTNEEVLKYWRVAPTRVEIAVRRTSWLQAMSTALQEHAQVTTAVRGTMLRESPLDSVGHLKPDAHRYARMFQGDLELFSPFFLRSGKVTGERCSKLVIQLLNSVC